MTVGQAIKQEREARNRTLRQVAGEAGISVGALSMIERGERANPSLDTLEGLARTLNLAITVDRRGVAVRPRRRTK